MRPGNGKRCAITGLTVVLAAVLVPPVCAQAEADSSHRWTVAPMLSFSDVSDGRDDWREASVDLYLRATPTWLLGARLAVPQRGDESDPRAGVSVAHQATSRFEWHADASFTTSADFSPDEAFGAGIIWNVATPVALLMDVRHLEFPEGDIDQYMPGVQWSIGDDVALTARYIHGRAFDARDYHAYVLRLDVGRHPSPQWRFTYVHGADPEKVPELGSVLLSSADSLAVMYRWPIRDYLDIVLGLEHERRSHLYSRSTANVGLIVRY
ncbi:YaiO family outer membrane beta-barrel protein [Tahibacter amnicola]|uniref:YaiO family outer membrane beta-barrel protein n=1 Tax=Tahibacter amnicola TaxID=2976241 RepID=A0ABY6B9V1_9GAMM|nr:YaiO family outer membrane beta-barrel protein [Tahibacter amnicola]UXI66644.1 YaiO family outer membrane beta-barrel protein [Tahibacter amnicola]